MSYRSTLPAARTQENSPDQQRLSGCRAVTSAGRPASPVSERSQSARAGVSRPESLRARTGAASSSGNSTSHQARRRTEEHTSELQSLMRISYAVFCLKKTKGKHTDKDYNKNAQNNN